MHPLPPPATPEEIRLAELRVANKAAGIFWMLCVEGAGNPSVKHYTIEDAEAEAIRLARLTQKPVTLLKSVGVFEIPVPLVNYRDLVQA